MLHFVTPDRLYYRYRSGADPNSMTLEQLKRLVRSAYLNLEREGWFQQGFGKDCVDDPHDIGAYVLEELGWDASPLEDSIQNGSEDELFTILEFLYDNVAKPVEKSWHSWNDCGWHVTATDVDVGQTEYRERINAMLARYENPHMLRDNGEIWRAAPDGMETVDIALTLYPSITTVLELLKTHSVVMVQLTMTNATRFVTWQMCWSIFAQLLGRTCPIKTKRDYSRLRINSGSGITTQSSERSTAPGSGWNGYFTRS